MTATAIEWTDQTCNVVAGCTALDEGCRNCYAAEWATRFPAHAGLAERRNGRAVWTREILYRPDLADELEGGRE